MFDILAIIAGLLISPAYAQNVTCATRPVGDSSNACASTAFVANPTFHSFRLTGNESLSLPLTDQAQPIIGSMYVTAPSISEAAMEFFDAGEFSAVTGATISKLAINNYLRAKVGFYRAVTGGAPAGDLYAGNFLCVSNNGHSGNCISGELDLNDHNTVQNSAVSFADLEAGLNLRAGLYIAGSTINPTSGAILINMTANGFKAQRAIGVYNGTIAGDVYDDNVDAPAGNVIRSVGTKAGGIELSGLTVVSGIAVDLKQGASIRWINGAGTQTSAIAADGSNILQLGTGGAGVNLVAPVTVSDGTKTVTPVTCSANQFVNAVNGSGVPTCATPTTGSSTAAAGSSGQFQTNSSGSLAGVTISGAVTIDGTTGIATLAAGQAVANLGYTPVNKAGDTMSGALFISEAFPQVGLIASGNSVDNKFWRTFVDGSGNFVLGTLNDALTVGATPLIISRSGITPTLATLAAPLYINTAIGTGAPFTYAGITQYNAQLIDVTASNASAAEGGLLVNVNSNAGTNATHYKIGMVSQVTVNSGGGMGFGANFLCNLGSALANTATTGCNGMEIDINNADATRSGNVWTSNANRSVGLVINGSGLFQNNTALEITSARTGGPLWEVGLRFSQNAVFGVAAIASATVADEVTSNNSYLDTGSHIYGLALAGTYSGAAIIVQGSAGVTCASITAATVTVKGGIVTHC